MTDRHQWDPQASLGVGRGDASSLVRTADVTARPGWKRRFSAATDRNPVLAGSIGSAVGAAFALILVGVEHVAPFGVLPELARLPLSTARVLLAALAGTIVVIVAVLFWSRSSGVQFSSAPVPAHLMHRLPGERGQRSRMAFVVGTLAYVAVTIWFLPADERGVVPQLASGVGIGLVLGSVLAVIASVAASSRFMVVGEVTGRLATNLVEQIRGWDQDGGMPVNPGGAPSPAVGEPASVTAKRSGWVRGIDEAALLDGLSAGSVVWMETRIGAFVMEHEPLCTVWSPGPTSTGSMDGVRAAIDIGPVRKLECDVDYGIQLLADAVSRSLLPGNADTAGATEGILQLGVVMRELLITESPPQVRVDSERRCLVRAKDLSTEDYTSGALAHLDTEVVARNRAACRATIDVLGRLVGVARSRGDDRAALSIRSHVVQLIERCRRLKLPRGHIEELVRAARACGFEDIV